MTTQPDTIPVPRAVVEGVIQYLATRPYKEVAEGIGNLVRLLDGSAQQAQRLDQPIDPATERAVASLVRNGSED